MTAIIHVDFRTHAAARRMPSPQGLAEGSLYDATWRLWRASSRAIEARLDHRRSWPAIQTLWDALDYPASERLKCAAGATLATLGEERV